MCGNIRLSESVGLQRTNNSKWITDQNFLSNSLKTKNSRKRRGFRRLHFIDEYQSMMGSSLNTYL